VEGKARLHADVPTGRNSEGNSFLFSAKTKVPELLEASVLAAKEAG
jgi:hypothetical protein